MRGDYPPAASNGQANAACRPCGFLAREDEALKTGRSAQRTLQASAEAYSKHGVNAHGIIIDELHAQPNRELVDVLTTSTAARRQPLIVYITTADFDRESICNEKYDYACKVRDGVIDDPAFLPVIYEAPSDADSTDPQVWADANPNLGVSVSEEYLERECQRAQETPTYENTFKRLHLNMKTQQDVRRLSPTSGSVGAVGRLRRRRDRPEYTGGQGVLRRAGPVHDDRRQRPGAPVQGGRRRCDGRAALLDSR